MIDVRKIEVRSIEELIQALHPVQVATVQSDSFEDCKVELRLMKNNISAILSFTSSSLDQSLTEDEEFRHVVDEVRRECLLVNGMISSILFRKRWLFAKAKVQDACDVLAHYEDMANAACRMCQMMAPELSNNLLGAF
jgi:NADH/NAD ratio-sensing transcriptional regulator Rex